MLIRMARSMFLSLAVTSVAVNSATSSAQPILPPAAEEGELPVQPPADAEPGYLGLIADDRRDQGSGVRVVRITKGAPAADAGLVVDDLIVAIDGKPVGSLDVMAAQLQPHGIGKKVRFEVRRGDATQTIDVTLGRRPPRDERAFEFGRIPERSADPNSIVPPADAAPPPPAPELVAPDRARAPAPRGQLLGIRTGAVTEEVRKRLRLPQVGGARVVSRVVGSPAEQVGLPLEAVIVAVDDQPVTSPVDLAQLIAAAGPGKEVELAYYAGGERRMLRVRLANVASRPLVAEEGPLDGQAAPPLDAAERIEQLERRIRELEERVQELERVRNARPAAQSADGR